jgi:hypothetical protein
MNENEIIDVEDVKIEDMDGSGHPILTVIVSLLGGAALGTGGTLLCKKLIGNDETKLKRKQKKLEKLKRDAEKLGIDLDIPEIEIPEDEELDGEIDTETGKVKVEVKTDSKKKSKKKGE